MEHSILNSLSELDSKLFPSVEINGESFGLSFNPLLITAQQNKLSRTLRFCFRRERRIQLDVAVAVDGANHQVTFQCSSAVK